jgi:predicted acylesterase/phospholipase RssA
MTRLLAAEFRKKVAGQRFLPASETGVGPDGLKYQTGVVTGQKIKLFFNQLVGDYLGEREIDRLPLPLSIIATDIVHGQRVVFRSGSLTTAMRASMSVPGLMSPVEINGEKLVDGGLVDNVPIDEARTAVRPTCRDCRQCRLAAAEGRRHQRPAERFGADGEYPDRAERHPFAGHPETDRHLHQARSGGDQRR